MLITLITSIAAILCMILLLIFYPKLKIGKINIETFYFPLIIGAIVILSTNSLDIGVLGKELTATNSINPLMLLGLFFSMTFLSIVLDEIGFFEMLASYFVKKAKNNQYILFLIIFLLAGVLTIFTSNDVIVITFTPFIIFFAKRARINALPYLFAELVSANTFSMFLLIGNPTNIYLGTSLNISFNDYFTHMYLATILGGITSLLIMFIIFHKDLKSSINIIIDEAHVKDKVILGVGLSLLISTIILMAISSYINIPIYLVSIVAAIILVIFLLFYGIKTKESFKVLWRSFKRLPYSLIVFLLSMFVMALAFKENGISERIAGLLNNNFPILSYGLSSFLMANLMNNLPMSILYSSIINFANQSLILKATYASIIGSNIGAYLTPLGALAGIMWMNILKEHQINFSFVKFTMYGFIVAIPTILASLLGLYLVMLI